MTLHVFLRPYLLQVSFTTLKMWSDIGVVCVVLIYVESEHKQSRYRKLLKIQVFLMDACEKNM